MQRSLTWSVALVLVACNAPNKTPPAADSDAMVRVDGGSAEGGGSGASDDDSPGAGGSGGADAGPDQTTVNCSVASDSEILIHVGTEDDADGNCSNGVQLALSLPITGARAKSPATLDVGGEQTLGTVSEQGESVEFETVTLPLGLTEARVEVDQPGAECHVGLVFDVACISLPTCELEALAPVLNGVSAANGGPRVSALGAPYQTVVEATTSLDDGEFVLLRVDGKEDQAVSVQDGRATFPGAVLGAEGEHTLAAVCVGADGARVASEEQVVWVDSVAPGVQLAPPFDVNGPYIPSAIDVDADREGLQFDVCASLSGEPTELCLLSDGVELECAPVANGETCVRMDCPGSGAFGLTLEVRDDAMNRASAGASDVTCASLVPLVRIANLPSAPTGEDPSRRLLAAGMGLGFEDQDGTRLGAQHDVIACSNSSQGTAQLLVGSGATLSPKGDPVALLPASEKDGCGGLGWTARFEQVTLPESPTAAGALQEPTSVQVELTTGAETAQSPVYSFWVDSTRPNLSVSRPVGGLCARTFRQTSDLQTELRLNAGAFPVMAQINDEAELTLDAETTLAGVTEMATVVFPLGVNTFRAWVSEPSGNTSQLPAEGADCTVVVGEPPIVAWTSPSASTLDAASDADATADGWQGTLSVAVTEFDASGGTHQVHFSYDLGQGPIALGDALVVGDAAGGTATLDVTLPEATTLTLRATMDPVDVFVPTAPALSLTVDVGAPGAPAGLAAAIAVRREASVDLTFVAPSESGSALAGYEVYWATAPITSVTLDTATRVAFTGDPKAAEVTTRVGSLPMETDVYFAVRALDLGGNIGALTATTTPVKSEFRVTTLVGEEQVALGSWVDGSADILGGRQTTDGTWLAGDGIPDLMVGSWGGEVRIYQGLPRQAGAADSPLFDTSPTVRLIGAASGLFGERAVSVGDVNSDGMTDFAVTAPYDGPHGQGVIYVWFGRRPTGNNTLVWPSELASTSADVVIQTPGTSTWAGDCPTCTNLGNALVPLGDFNGDGVDDFAFGAYRAGTAPQEGGYAGVLLGAPDLPSYLELPENPNSEPGAHLISIPGTTLDSRFGTGMVGLGPLFGSGGNGLLVAAGNSETLATYSFADATTSEQSTGLLQNALQSFPLQVERNDYGRVTTMLAGGVIVSASPCAQYFYPCSGSSGGFADFFFGPPSDPFSGRLSVRHRGSLDYDFGVSILGSARAQSATLRTFALVGPLSGPQAKDADFAMVDQGVDATHPERGPVLYLFSGQEFKSWVNSGRVFVDVNLPDHGAVVLNVATKAGFDLAAQTWAGTASLTAPVADVDGDGYAELVVSEFGAYDAILNGKSALNYPGRIAILW